MPISPNTSIFMDKAKMPETKELAHHLNDTFKYWLAIRDFVFQKYPKAFEEWNHSGAKYGWNFRIKDKKRAIIYFLPRQGFFKVAFVFGQKAMNQIMESNIAIEIKTELQQAKVYAEGRGIRIEIVDDSKLEDIKKLVEIKIAN